MRILVTADLHYDIARSREPALRLAEQICRTPADALVLVGDTAGRDLEPLSQCLHLFDSFAGRKLLVPGNHCLWRRQNEDSMHRYRTVLPAAAAEAGFTVLDHQPVELAGVGLVGSIGWYDYSMRDESLEIPLDFYRAKVAPGAARYLDEEHHRRLLSAHAGELGPRQMSLGARWMDGQNVRLGMTDEEFVALLAGALRRQIDELSPRVGQIIAFLHHLAFKEQTPPGRPDRFAFCAAFMGSTLLGEVLLASPKVTHVFCGHSHWPDDRNIGRLKVVNIGSTYVSKRMYDLMI